MATQWPWGAEGPATDGTHVALGAHHGCSVLEKRASSVNSHQLQDKFYPLKNYFLGNILLSLVLEQELFSLFSIQKRNRLTLKGLQKGEAIHTTAQISLIWVLTLFWDMGLAWQTMRCHIPLQSQRRIFTQDNFSWSVCPMLCRYKCTLPSWATREAQQVHFKGALKAKSRSWLGRLVPKRYLNAQPFLPSFSISLLKKCFPSWTSDLYGKTQLPCVLMPVHYKSWHVFCDWTVVLFWCVGLH